VVRAALQGAASVAGLPITTEAMVAELPQRNRDNPAMPAGGGMDFSSAPIIGMMLKQILATRCPRERPAK
jgi:hypothetical protein